MATGLIERMREDNTLLNAYERFPLFLNDHFIEVSSTFLKALSIAVCAH